jgi:hypothetical protein
MTELGIEIEDAATAEAESGAPEAPSTETPTPAETAEPTWAPPASQADYEAAMQEARAEAYAEAFANLDMGFDESAAAMPTAPEAQAPAMGGELDSLAAQDPELARYVSDLVERQVSQRLEQIEPTVNLVAAQVGTKFAEDYMEQLSGHIGEFDHQHALAIANGLIERGVDPGPAFQRAAVMQRQHEEALTRTAYERGKSEVMETLQNHQTAPAEPGATVAASEARSAADAPPDWDAIGNGWARGLRPVAPAG